MKRGCLISLTFILIASNVFASAQSEQPFAYSASFTLLDKQLKFNGFEIPGFVYRHSYEQPIQNILIVDKTGRVQPYTIRYTPVTKQASHPAKAQWLELTAEKFSRRTTLIYHVKGHYPLRWLRLKTRHLLHNTQIKIESRSNKQTRWQLRYRGKLATYQFPTRSPLWIAPMTDRDWRIELPKQADSKAEVILELGWIADRVIFVAQGQEPFSLLFSASHAPIPLPKLGTVLHAANQYGAINLSLDNIDMGEMKALGDNFKIIRKESHNFSLSSSVIAMVIVGLFVIILIICQRVYQGGLGLKDE